MKPTEKLLLAGYTIVSAIAIYYIHKCNKLDKQNEILKDKNDFLLDYIENKEGFLDD